MAIIIRPIEHLSEYHGVEQIQREAWGMEDIHVVPLNILVTMQHNGGLVAGAFDTTVAADSDEHATPIGFVLNFPGLTPDGHLKQCSHMAGVIPAYQNQNIGFQLKCWQRDYVLQQGIDLITWTFDPLLSRNAHLNIHKLGATCCTYVRDVYGRFFDTGAYTFPTDRFQVDWHLNSSHVSQYIENTAKTLAQLRQDEPDIQYISPLTFDSSTSNTRMLVEIPLDIAAMKTTDPHQAMQWYEHTRHCFETLFHQGYTATNFLMDEERGYYLMEQPSERTDGAE